MDKVFSIVRQRKSLSPRDEMKDLDVNAAIWSIKLQFMQAKTTRRI